MSQTENVDGILFRAVSVKLCGHDAQYVKQLTQSVVGVKEQSSA